jgi:hypothetical protein
MFNGKPAMVVHTFNPSTQEAEGELQVPNQLAYTVRHCLKKRKKKFCG